jgi:uncharacterized protein YqeY
MTLLNKIITARNESRGVEANKIKYDILTLVLGEIETLAKRTGKATTDEAVVTIIKKLIKSNTTTISLVGAERGRLEALQNITMYEFIPEEYSEDEVYEFLSGVVFGSVGEAMGYMEREHKGKYDKRMASKVAKDIISQ